MILLFIILATKSQDVHFSQNEATPLLINPANTGAIQEDYRVIINYRKQWTSLGTPFVTYASSFDKPIQLKKQKLGIGVAVVRDNSVNLKVRKTDLLVSLSYNYQFKNNLINLGIQPGISNMSFDDSQLTLPEQYNMYTSLYDPNFPISEEKLNYHSTNFDLNAGLSWTTILKTFHINSGINFSHINNPKVKWGNRSNNIPSRMLLHGSLKKELFSYLAFSGSCIIVKQQKADAILFGGTANLILPWNTKRIKELFIGSYFRSAIFENIDAYVITGGIKNCEKMDIYITYDFNISSLSNATNNKGAFELSIVYKGIFQNKRSFEPPCIIN